MEASDPMLTYDDALAWLESVLGDDDLFTFGIVFLKGVPFVSRVFFTKERGMVLFKMRFGT